MSNISIWSGCLGMQLFFMHVFRFTKLWRNYLNLHRNDCTGEVMNCILEWVCISMENWLLLGGHPLVCWMLWAFLRGGMKAKTIPVSRKGTAQSWELRDFSVIGNSCKPEPGQFLMGISALAAQWQLCQAGSVPGLGGSKWSRWWDLQRFHVGESSEGRNVLEVACRKSVKWVHAKDMSFKEEKHRKASLVYI